MKTVRSNQLGSHVCRLDEADTFYRIRVAKRYVWVPTGQLQTTRQSQPLEPLPRSPNPFAARIAEADQLNSDELARLQAGNYSNPPPSSLPYLGYGNQVSGAVSGVAAGAASGYATGGPVGAVVGGALGNANNATPPAHLEQSQARVAALQAQQKFVEAGDLLFPEGGYKLSPAGQAELANNIAPKLKNLPPNAKIVVYSHTDNLPVAPALQQQGIPDNLFLSARQAADVANFLISQGIPAASISAKGLGDTRPVTSGDTPQGRAQNRRIEITIQGPG